VQSAIVVHGGAGAIEPAREEACRAGCRAAAASGWQVLKAGGTARAAAVAAVRTLEENPEFNAGLGACLTRTGSVELDAAVMCGQRFSLGAVGAVVGVESGILLADAILEDGEHIFLCGEGAVAFAREKGLTLCPPDALITPRARNRLRKWMEKREARMSEPPPESVTPDGDSLDRGTVGAVAVDAQGHYAAATSTGGMVGKRPGRVGDTPLIGCGTYADDRAGGAASATGHGEQIARVLLCRTAVDYIAGGMTAAAAARASLDVLRNRTSASAGIILVDREGRLGHHRTTKTMPWASVVDDKVEDGV
jgi:beta-aspartyl-peptidase (threonine type)